MNHREKRITKLASAISLACVPSLSFAAGYALNEQSASAMGTANAGAAANPENATVLFFNPAGISQLDKPQVSFGAAYIEVSTDFEGTAVDTIGRPVDGTNGGEFVDPAIIPNLYATMPINENWSAGIGIFAPFGVAGDYDSEFVGRFMADETELKAIAIQPTVAYKFNDVWSVGLGIDFVHAEGTLTKFQDYSGTGLPPALLKEGHFDVEGDDEAIGWNFGILYQPTNSTTVGLNYRSKIDIELEGEATLTNVPGQAATLEEKAKVPLTLPESATISLKHLINDQWTVYAGATWTRWSQFENLDIFSREDGGLISASASLKYGKEGMIGHVPEKWTNTWAVSAGVSYAFTQNFMLKAGYAFDESPIQKEYRTARVPATDRNWLTVGAQYKMEGDWVIDGAFGYLIIDDIDVDEHEYRVDGTQIGASNLKGTYEVSAYGLAVQLTKSF
ncbi:OmpP1/FadL family transporter [Litoribacillus peritrichatus]|uniref:Outer membrane protein transport protein n=1 Tax=Litoribacillus peritrichatus TaxID=718191 RepID=A0ABP7M827_9GAMM